MSTRTTTETFPVKLPLRGAALALAAWFGGIAIATAALDPQDVVVFGPASTEIVLRASAFPLSSGGGFTLAHVAERGAVRALYAGGAWFVWPVMRAGCGG